MLKKYIAGVMLGKSELRHLSLYDNELEGQTAIEDIKEIMQMLTKLEFIDIDGNMMYMLDLIALQKVVKNIINFDGRQKPINLKIMNAK